MQAFFVFLHLTFNGTAIAKKPVAESDMSFEYLLNLAFAENCIGHQRKSPLRRGERSGLFLCAEIIRCRYLRDFSTQHKIVS